MDIRKTPYSNLKIFDHADVIRALKEEKRVAPVYVRIKPTNYCNHKCSYCSYADKDLVNWINEEKKKKQIPWENMQAILEDMQSMGVKAITFSGGGEPLLYPHIEESLQRVLDAGIDLSIITNGHLLKGQKADLLAKSKWVRVSMDAANAETYAKIRQLPLQAFDEVCDNIRAFAKIKEGSCELGVNFVVTHENAEQIYDMAKLLKGLGVNHVKYTARVMENLFEYHEPIRENVIAQIYAGEKEFNGDGFSVINKYESDFDAPLINKRLYKKCYMNDITAVIGADENVYFCHDKAYSEAGKVGDLSLTSFKELWFLDEVVKRYKNFDAEEECCHHCVYDDRNELLGAFFGMDRNHINFI
ncbi:radical SAM protein [Lachnospiraceae bacterium ZAX-1]